MSASKTVVRLAGAVALLWGLDAYVNREIRSLSAEVTGTKRSIVAEVAPMRRAGRIHESLHFRIPGTGISCEPAVNEIAKDEVSGSVTVARNSEIARGYSIGSAETRNLPGR